MIGRNYLEVENFRKKILIIRTICFVSALLVVGGIIEVLIHHYDPTRVIYKRLKADDEYVYEKIDPTFLTIDPGSLILVKTLADVHETRARLIDVFWGDAGFPTDVQPTAVEYDVSEEAFRMKLITVPEGCARIAAGSGPTGPATNLNPSPS